MDNRARSVRLIAALLMVVCMLLNAAAALAAADPVRVSSLSEPQSVISEQEVDITIKVYNSSQEDMTCDITLYDPQGNPLETYKGLKGENSVTYTGTWNVTRDEIDAGKIKFYIRYMVDTDEGPKENIRTVPVTIQTEEAVPQLTATYSVSATAAREGQEVTLSYTLSNTGNVELRSIVIENSGVTKEKVTAASLSVGEKITLTDTFTMGDKELVSKPQITYQAAGSNKEMTISDLARKTITVAEDGLEVTLKADRAENVYPGETVTFAFTLKNSGNTPYTGLSALLEDGTSVASGVELAPGASFEGEFTRSFTEEAAVAVNVTGSDDAGNPVGMASNEVRITTQDASRALVLDVDARVETDVIHSEPAVLRFAVLVKNTGETDATNLTVTQNDVTVARIPSLPSGESKLLVLDLETSIAGQFRFDVAGKDAAGVEKVYSSDVMAVAYVAPTPAPTATPSPTPVPPTPTPVPTATPVPTLGEIIAQKVDPIVLYSAAGVLGGLLVLILTVSGVNGARRRKRMAGALDTIELSPDVRNHRGVKHKRKKKKADKPAAKPEGGAIVPTQDLESEAPAQPASQTPARDALNAEREEGRRRRANMVVSTEETLRVVPVDERPEFVAQGKVDDSKTRIFSRVSDTPAEPAAPKAPEKTPADEQETVIPPVSGGTIRFDKAEVEEVNRREEAAKKAPKGKKRDELKPMKKKKKGFFGGRKKDEDLIDDLAEDLIDADEDLDVGEDEFI